MAIALPPKAKQKQAVTLSLIVPCYRLETIVFTASATSFQCSGTVVA